MNNRSIIERLTSHLINESCNCVEVILRTLIAEEETATAHYLKYAHKIAKKAEESGDRKVLKVVKVLEDIANEEKVHVGELQKCLSSLGINSDEQRKGEKEAQELLRD